MNKKEILANRASEVVLESEKLVKERKSIYFSADEMERLKGEEFDNTSNIKTMIEYRNEDVVKTIQLEENPIVLNFASAKHAGGGFLKGTVAQEEAIARASDMYLYLKDQQEFYKNPKHYKNGYYDNDMILSKDVTLLHDANGNKVDHKVFQLITSAAVNVKDLKAKGEFDTKKVAEEMKKRIENVFEVALRSESKVLVVGAFGCGVFENNPYEIKNIFKNVLVSERYKDKFEKIIFSIYDAKLLGIFKS